ncbi:MAG TPA: heterodisulfide reductase-related iron-sulfur binding cluster [Anaeromyxobacteraceae bacterium]|nr:heterodisulfide reductase-related iron-sulfur binding cluster [Anaeromyxobacteraceae bacterium]
MSDATTVKGYEPTPGLSYDPTEPVYWERKALDGEVHRAFEICNGCRMCFKYCDAFPLLFDLLDKKDHDVRRLTAGEIQAVMEGCFQCKLCEVQCPYTPRDNHPFQLDFPALVHRYTAVTFREGGERHALRDRFLGDPDAAGKMARMSLGLANAMNKLAPARWVMEKTIGIDRRKLLPNFATETFDAWAEKNGYVKPEPGGEVVLFQTCYVQNNDTSLGKDVLEVYRKNGVDIRVVRGLRCCGMPAWEYGELGQLRRQAREDLDLLLPFVERGAKVLVVNPTCSMMMRREWPRLLDVEDRARAEKLAPAVLDVSEYLWSIRNEPRFNTDFKSIPPGGKVAYHAPCHLRAQAVGFKGRDLLRKIPGVEIAATVMECCGHDGTYAMTVEGFGPSQRVGEKAFAGMKGAEAALWCTDCPLAAVQFRQFAGNRPLHPMQILARAYRPDGFGPGGER